jgi:RNA polymerase sigma-70 factor (ECF subfamily)
MRAGVGFYAEIDDRLIAKARSGDVDAFEALYRVFSGPVYTLARRLCRSREEAEEVLQETFLEIARSLRAFRGDGAIGAWVRRISVSKALTLLRRRKSGAGELETGVNDPDVLVGMVPVAEVDIGWQRVDLERALERLPDVTRAVVWLHDVEGFTHAEIAEVFGQSTSFSKSQLSRAHARLRSWLGRRGGIEDASESGRTAGAARR